MKKFQFSLDTVLDYRRQVQDSLQVELSALTAQVRRQEGVLTAAREKYAAINREYCGKKAGGMTIAEVRGYEIALEVQERIAAAEAAALKKLQRQAEAKRRELVGAKQDASSVEKLREKKLLIYTKDLEKSEEQFIDDLVCAGRGSARGVSL